MAPAICCCCGRISKFFAFANKPAAEKIASTLSAKSEGTVSRRAIMEAGNLRDYPQSGSIENFL